MALVLLPCLVACRAIPVDRVWLGLSRAVSSAPGSAIIVVIYACAVTCAQSFTVLSVWGVLISLWSVSVSIIVIGYYCYYYFHGAPGSV